MAHPDVKLIGIHGVKESGKDTTADFMQQYAAQRHESFGKDWFARRMKESIAALFGITVEQVDILKTSGFVFIGIDGVPGLTELTIEMRGREFLQRYGTESHRGVFGWDFWIDQLLPLPPETYEGIKYPWRRDNFEGKDLCVIADVRFENEIARIHECGGVVVYLDRPTEGEADSHVSEQMFPELCDYTINNDADLPHLERQTRDAITFLYG